MQSRNGTRRTFNIIEPPGPGQSSSDLSQRTLYKAKKLFPRISISAFCCLGLVILRKDFSLAPYSSTLNFRSGSNPSAKEFPVRSINIDNFSSGTYNSSINTLLNKTTPFVSKEKTLGPNAYVGEDNMNESFWTKVPSFFQDEEEFWVRHSTPNQPKPNSAKITVVILTMNRFQSLRRMIMSLFNSDYTSKEKTNTDSKHDGNATAFDQIDLVLRFDQLPPKYANEAAVKKREESIQQLCKDLLSGWKYGNVKVVMSMQNLGLAESWFRAWNPKHHNTEFTGKSYDLGDEEPRALILEDDLELSPIWYQWLRGVHDAYGGTKRRDVASFSLSHQELVPLKDRKRRQTSTRGFPQNEPFLYALLGSHGFSPIAHKWTEFIDFVRCSQIESLSVLTPGLVTSDWYQKKSNKHKMWTQHFIYFCMQRRYYNMYQFPSSKALAAHWQEKGEHFDGGSRGRNFELVQDGDVPLFYPKKPKKYDWGANLINNNETVSNVKNPVVVMSAAIGYDLKQYQTFVGSLRRVYSGDVMLLISDSAPAEVTLYLQDNNIGVITTKDPGNHRGQSTGWENLNRARFTFFEDVCDERRYSLCLTTDFRDSLFQFDPFHGIEVPGLHHNKSMLFVYEHDLKMNAWHYKKMKSASCGLYEKYHLHVENKNIINGGSMIASPDMYNFLVQYMTDIWKGCNDQVVLNILIRANMTPSDSEIEVSPQGVGNMNVVGFARKIIKGLYAGQFLNLDCLPSPVVHQYDIVGRHHRH